MFGSDLNILLFFQSWKLNHSSRYRPHHSLRMLLRGVLLRCKEVLFLLRSLLRSLLLSALLLNSGLLVLQAGVLLHLLPLSVLRSLVLGATAEGPSSSSDRGLLEVLPLDGF